MVQVSGRSNVGKRQVDGELRPADCAFHVVQSDRGAMMDITGWLAGETTGLEPLEMLLRLAIAGLFGALVGFDRELKNKPAGLRTHTLISLAAALFTLITLELYDELSEPNSRQGLDPFRIINAVTSGVAFIAAGAIIRSGGNVRGLTTGANMWLAGAIGLACGAGFYTLAVFGAAFSFVIITLLQRLEKRFLQDAHDKKDETTSE